MVTKTDKQEAIALIERLPDGISLESIVSELLVRVKVLRGLAQMEHGEFVTHEEVKERMTKWRQSAGA